MVYVYDRIPTLLQITLKQYVITFKHTHYPSIKRQIMKEFFQFSGIQQFFT